MDLSYAPVGPDQFNDNTLRSGLVQTISQLMRSHFEPTQVVCVCVLGRFTELSDDVHGSLSSLGGLPRLEPWNPPETTKGSQNLETVENTRVINSLFLRSNQLLVNVNFIFYVMNLIYDCTIVSPLLGNLRSRFIKPFTIHLSGKPGKIEHERGLCKHQTKTDLVQLMN